MSKFVLWVLLFLNTYAAPGRPQYLPDAIESKEDALARYEAIARDIEEVAKTETPLFKGPQAQSRTASVLLSVMLFESGIRKDVDSGVGSQARGDGGRSWCMLQQNVGKGRTLAWNTVKNRPARAICKDGQVSTTGVPCDPTAEVHPGWTGPELVADRKNCFRAGLRAMRLSFAACSRLPTADWLRSYASGSCENGAEASSRRMNFAMRWFANHKPEPDTVMFLTPVPLAPLAETPIALEN